MRENYLDAARGLGIVLVVFGHVQRGLNDAGLLGNHYPFREIDFALYTFHMPLFFLLSGIHVWSSLLKGRARFLKTKFTTIIVPYFLWSIIQASTQIMMSGSVNHPLHWTDWPHLFYAPIGQFWFLYALLVWQLIALASFPSKPLLMVLAVVSFTAGQFVHSPFLAEVMKMGLFFAFGTIFGPQIVVYFREKSAAIVAGVAIPVYLVSVISIWDITSYDTWAALPAAVAGIFMTLAISKMLSSAWNINFIYFLGKKSMPIYVMHIMAASGTRIILTKLAVTNTAAHIIIGVTAGVFLPLIADALIQRVKSLVREWSPNARSTG